MILKHATHHAIYVKRITKTHELGIVKHQELALTKKKYITSILCRVAISKLAKLFKTFNTPVATSSKFDGRTYDPCN